MAAFSAVLFCVLPAKAQAPAKVMGRVVDASGASVPRASLTLRQQSRVVRQAVTGTDGRFEFRGLPPGIYALGVSSPGLAPENREISLSSGQTLELDLRLSPAQLRQSVDVVAAADPVSGSVTKMDVPLLETPQAISVIPREQLEEQAPLRLQEALRYTAGVSAETYGFDTRGDWATVRGGDDWGQYLNGLRMLFGYYNNVRPDPFTMERIEVMRGPSSVLFGQSGFGGVVNLVSKRPLAQHRREIQVQLGNYRRRQVALDLTGPIDRDSKWLYRLVGLGRDSNTQVDYVPEDRLLFAPSLTWRPRSATSFTVLTNFQQDKSGSSVGFFPWQGTLLRNAAGKIPTNTFISEPGFDEYRTEQTAVGYLFSHQFNSRWTIRQNLNYMQSKASYQTIYSRFAPKPMLEEDGRTLPRTIYISKPDATSPLVDTQAESRFRTGVFSHTVLMGVDFQQAVINQLWGFDTAPPIDVFQPEYGNFTVPPLNRSPENRQSQKGIYAQDHIQLTERLSTTLGVRKDWARSESVGQPDSLNEDTAVTGRAGLVYATGGGFAPYLSYSRSFQPLAGTDVFNNPYDPIYAQQWELGAKFQPGLSNNLVTASAFDIREQNRLTPDPQNPLNSIQVGEAHIRGFELESRAKPFWRLNLLVNYTFLDARISESHGPDLGKRLPAVPKHFGSVWAVKNFQVSGLEGFFSAGGGVRYNGSSFDGDDFLRTPSYTLYDLMLAYDRGDWRIAVNAANLTDKVHITACLARGDCFYGIRRTITATVGYRF